MDVARMNFSHGDHSDHEANLADVRAAAEATGRNVAILLDLQGPKIRIGRFVEGSVELTVGEEFVITTEDDHVYELHGEVSSSIPLRNRRDGMVTRLTEGLTRWTLDGREGAGLSEYLDQVVDDVPVGTTVGL